MMDDQNAPATKGDVAGLRAELKQDIVGLRAELKQDIEQVRSEFNHGFDDIRETMRDGQTELLKAFYSFAHRIEVKLKDSEVAEFMLRQRLTVAESRITEIEKRLNMPPAA
jgi:hypothetical protein